MFRKTPKSLERDFERDLKSELDEAKSLAKAIGLETALLETPTVYNIAPATLLGRGACQIIHEKLESAGDEKPVVVIVNFQLSPVQQRNLEKELGVKVIDRTGLILEIFGARAQTREGKIQVELAALQYQRSRLVKSWTHLERQRGGGGFMGGPGETQLEIDRRMIDDKIARLKLQLQEVKRTRDLGRAKRERVPFPIVALVGYTNAGKSTLFNALTGADVFAEDLVFATLDPTLRQIKLPNGRVVILSDTVGFIANLPTQLVAAFRATLEQVLDADVILHVRDVSSPDLEAQREDVIKVLSELGLDYHADPRIIEVWNKMDAISDPDHHITRHRDFNGAYVPISAIKGDGFDTLLSNVSQKLSETYSDFTFNILPENGKALAWLHRHAFIKEKREDEAAGVIHVTAAMDEAVHARFIKLFAEEGVCEV